MILDEDGEEEGDDVLFPDHIKKLCALLGSIYAFFVLELCLSKRQSHSHRDGGHGNHEIIDLDVQVNKCKKIVSQSEHFVQFVSSITSKVHFPKSVIFWADGQDSFYLTLWSWQSTVSIKTS